MGEPPVEVSAEEGAEPSARSAQAWPRTINLEWAGAHKLGMSAYAEKAGEECHRKKPELTAVCGRRLKLLV